MATCKEAGTPLPTFSEDDFVNYCVIEAMVMKARKEEVATRKKEERDHKVREAKTRLMKKNG